MRTYITYEEALRIIISQDHLLPEETISLFEAHNRVLREDLIADRDDPPAPVSAMDGYGVRGEDVEGAPVELKVIGEIPAGKVPEIELKRGEAVKLFTGSLIPRGVNTVVPVEYTEERRGKVLIRKPLKKWQNVRPRGENYRKGEVLVERGTVLGAPEIGIASSVGKPFLRVSSKPRVGIIATGSEVF
ncbi:MAG: molybdopterin molybdenumtransferase MoeA, partial [Thermovibrio sp.]